MPTTLTLALLFLPLPTGPRPIAQLRVEVRAAMRAEAAADDPAQHEPAVIRLAEIYGEICSDPRLQSSRLLQKQKARLWGRLIHIKRDLKKQLAYAERKTERRREQTAVLENAQAADAARGAERHRVAMGGAAITDYGPSLVALIERTIDPDFWDVHGGPGSVVYYRPLRVLVVRATEEIHEKIGGVAGGLR